MSEQAVERATAKPRARRTTQARSPGSHGPRYLLRLWTVRFAVLAAVIAGWQFLPEISRLRTLSPIFDPFFVSSPTKIARQLIDMMLVRNGQVSIWPDLGHTLEATFIGTGIGLVAGAAAGLVLSNTPFTASALKPFIATLNSIPRIALIPVFVILFGPTLEAATVATVFVVFFLVFYNAFNGGLSVPAEMIQNARLLGAGPREIMFTIRLPHVLVWTFASFPNAISFGLVATVTSEVFTGTVGMGLLLTNALDLSNATLTFTVVVALTIVGVTLVSLADLLKHRVLHWWVSEA